MASWRGVAFDVAAVAARMPKLITSFAFAAILASFASASSHQHYRRADADSARVARTWLDARAHADVSVRVFRGRLTLGGNLPDGEVLATLERELAGATGVASVHH